MTIQPRAFHRATIYSKLQMCFVENGGNPLSFGMVDVSAAQIRMVQILTLRENAHNAVLKKTGQTERRKLNDVFYLGPVGVDEPLPEPVPTDGMPVPPTALLDRMGVPGGIPLVPVPGNTPKFPVPGKLVAPGGATLVIDPPTIALFGGRAAVGVVPMSPPEGAVGVVTIGPLGLGGPPGMPLGEIAVPGTGATGVTAPLTVGVPEPAAAGVPVPAAAGVPVPGAVGVPAAVPLGVFTMIFVAPVGGRLDFG